jgi:hypothetical protein
MRREHVDAARAGVDHHPLGVPVVRLVRQIRRRHVVDRPAAQDGVAEAAVRHRQRGAAERAVDLPAGTAVAVVAAPLLRQPFRLVAPVVGDHLLEADDVGSRVPQHRQDGVTAGAPVAAHVPDVEGHHP